MPNPIPFAPPGSNEDVPSPQSVADLQANVSKIIDMAGDDLERAKDLLCDYLERICNPGEEGDEELPPDFTNPGIALSRAGNELARRFPRTTVNLPPKPRRNSH